MMTSKDILIRRTGTDPATASFYIKLAEEKVKAATGSTSIQDYFTETADIAICLLKQDAIQTQEREGTITSETFSEGGVSTRTDYETGWDARKGYDAIIQDILDKIKAQQHKVRFL